MKAARHEILIAGGGIGGLVAALALHGVGHRVVLAEAASAMKPLGVGINLLSHAVAILDGLGLLPRLSAAGNEMRALVFANRFGQTIHRDPRGKEAGASHPQISIHRGRLHEILLEAARESLGEGWLLTGHRLVGFTEERGRIVGRFAAAAGERRIEADLLVAADGIHSAARAQLYPDEGPPRWNGVMMWRGTTRAKPFLDGHTMVQAGIGDAKFVVYPLGRFEGTGEALINWIADIRRAPKIDGTRAAPSREDWSKPGRIEDLMPVFGTWRFDYLDVPQIIRGADAILEWPMVDRDPLPRWSHGRMTLLGDAAHPMYPIGSNGATQAILDAEALTRMLSAHADPVAALEAYEAERMPMTSEIVALNRKLGLDAVLDLVEERAPQGFDRIDDVIDPAEIAAMIGGYKRAAGHRVAAR